MNILYASTLCSERLLDHLSRTSKEKPKYSMQKFNRLLTRGFVANEHNVYTISSIPFSKKTTDQIVFWERNEIEDGIRYHYALGLNIPLLHNVLVMLLSFFYTLFWCLSHRNRVVVCDVLQVSICIGVMAASKLTFTKTAAIVTDMPGYMLGHTGQVRKGKSFQTRFIMSYVNNYDRYILLTEQMNEMVNLKKRPYVIMEGLVDSQMKPESRNPIRKPRMIIYAGGLQERYGLKMLVDAFDNLSTDYPDSQLHIYGFGPFVPYIKDLSKRNSQVIFHGAVTNDEVVEAELKATLLVNPRPTHEDFTKYSFPSKNMEYMVSGTPVLTTRLPGMPLEYHPYVYLFEAETTEGYEKTLRYVLSLPDQELDIMGRSAQRFVLDNKNNVFQAARVLKLLEQ